MADSVTQYTRQAIGHIRYLSETIGGRGSSTPREREAASYAAAQMEALGVEAVHLEPFAGASSTCRPYALAFGAGLAGTLAAWALPGRGGLVTGLILNLMGAWAMFAESDFRDNWTRHLLPRAPCHNAVGQLKPSVPVQQRAVLCAHIDTPRTPLFFSTLAWRRLYSRLVRLALLSLALGAFLYTLGAGLNWTGVRWIAILPALVQVLMLALCLYADTTPHSPGANDNASGVGLLLAMASRLVDRPLAHTEVWLACTGCEEAGAYGMAAFLDAHAAELGPQTLFIILDQVGQGQVAYLLKDGLIVRHATNPGALELAQQAVAALKDQETGQHAAFGPSTAGALVATRRGLEALTVKTQPQSTNDSDFHSHQMSDRLEFIDPPALERSQRFTWQLLKELDRGKMDLTKEP